MTTEKTKKKKINLKAKPEKKSRGWLKSLIAIFFVLSFLLFVYAAFYLVYFDGKFYPGFKIGGISLQGKTYKEASELLNNYTGEVAEAGLGYRFNEKEAVVFPVFSSAEGTDLVYEILKFSEEETLNQAYAYGRFGPLWKNFLAQISALINGLEVGLGYALDEDELLKILKENFSEYESPAENARLLLNEEGDFEIIPEKEGQVFDYEGIIARTRKRIENLDNRRHIINLEKDYPEIRAARTASAVSEIGATLARFPVRLLYEERAWEITPETGKTWLGFDFRDNEVVLGLNENFVSYLEEKIIPEINQEVKEGKFELKEGKVTEFQASQNGLAVDLKATEERVEKEIMIEGAAEAEIIVHTVYPTVTTDSINEMGVREIVGRGVSNFKGSPRNRVHNIKKGAETLHGLLIKPDEEFSLVKALGKIEAATGYLPELVIKGNRTIPEYGGGLCQIGTTAFRLAIHTGLPITERRPHSYRVSYYEPAGFDASIYDPKPDFRFINDTGHYLLLQTKIEGYDLIFEFYGTQDGRRIEVTKSTLSNFVSPPPTKYIESADLAPGEKKCTEKAHTGATAVFYRTITYPDGEQTKETWTSVYRPWQEVCLVGV